ELRPGQAHGVRDRPLGGGVAADLPPGADRGERSRLHGGQGELSVRQRARLRLPRRAARRFAGDDPAHDHDEGGWWVMPRRPRSLWAALQLLDRQITDADGMATAKVDDLEFTDPADGDLPVLTDLLCGAAALGRRFNRRLGAELERLRRVIVPVEDPGPARIS